MPGRMEFEFNPLRQPGAGGGRQRHDGEPFRLVVLGDFSGRTSAKALPLSERLTWRVDLDNIDTVLARLSPRLAHEAGEIAFAEIDDFHPDTLWNRLPLFAALRSARATGPAAGSDTAPTSGGDLLGQLLGGAPAAATPGAPSTTATGLDAFIQRIVAPHIVPDRRAETAAWQQAVDLAAGEQMRKLLHDPSFQALESAWRGVLALLQALELDDGLQVHLFDASREELLQDLVAAQGQVARTGLHQALVGRWKGVPGGQGWTLMTGLYRFGPDTADMALLAALSLVAQAAGAPLVADGHPSLAGDANEPALAGWQALRRSPSAPWLGLASPRVLLRQPYGKRSDPVSAFAFEELPAGRPDAQHLLWGPAALAVAQLLGRAYSARGWDFEPGDERQIDGLPAYSYQLPDGERELQAVAEAFNGEEALAAMSRVGLIALASHRHAASVTAVRMQSVAEPAAGLAGIGT